MKTIRRKNLELPELNETVFKKYGKVISTISNDLEYQYETESGFTLNYVFDNHYSESGIIEIY